MIATPTKNLIIKEIAVDRLAMFIPLAKADAAQRLVYGSFDETPDRAGEVCDYATAKPAFEAWSADLSKASEGKSLGNIRGQHANIAAGKLIEISFDDMAKSIGFVAKIVDDNEWRKVEEGVYTGFSPGGRYAKRWQDGAHKRYTPDVRELSIVDVPCNPSATFTMVKADGVEEDREFTLAKAYEPGNAATIERAEALAKAAAGQRKDFVVQARAELIAENAADALAKMAAAPELETKPDPVAELNAALAKANEVAKPVELEQVSGPFADLAKAADALKLITLADAPLAKGLYSVRSIADLMQQFSYLQSELCYEAKAEGDASPNPAKAAAIVKTMGELLIAVAQEEVAELIAAMPAMDPPTVVIVDGDAMELATQIVDLVKANTDLMEKAGARNSKSDAAAIQSMHDGAVKLGATCDATAEKDSLAALEADRDRLMKAVGDSVPQIEAMATRMEKLASDGVADRDRLTKALAEIETLKAQPAPAKGVLIAMEKANDGNREMVDEPAGAGSLDAIKALPNGPAKAAAIIASVGQRR